MASNLVCGLCVPIVGTHNRRSPNIFIPSVRSAKSPFLHGLIVVSLCSKTLASRRGPGIDGSQFFHSYESLRHTVSYALLFVPLSFHTMDDKILTFGCES